MKIFTKIKWIKSILNYLVKSYLYDLRRGTNTQMWYFSRFNSSKANDSLIYMGSTLEDIEESTKKLEKIIGKDLMSNSNLIDIGSGKGKVLLTWRKIYPENENILGFDYNKNLNKIALKNFDKLNYKSVKILHADASLLKIPKLNETFTVFFMYNPFGKKTINNFFKNNLPKKSALIYFNPLHSELIESFGYIKAYQRDTHMRGSSYKIFIKGFN